MQHLSVLEESLKFIRDLNSALPLYDYEGSAIKLAASLRQQSRDLRRKSESLRSKNMEVMNRASAIALHCYILNHKPL